MYSQVVDAMEGFSTTRFVLVYLVLFMLNTIIARIAVAQTERHLLNGVQPLGALIALVTVVRN